MTVIRNLSILLLTAFVLSLILSSCSDENPVDPAILPKITDFHPARAYAGTRVTLYGANFRTDSMAQVYIGSVRARITGGYHEQITIEIPYGAASGRIKVCTGKSCSESAKTFEVIPSLYYGSAAVEIRGVEARMRHYVSSMFPGVKNIDTTFYRDYDTVIGIKNGGGMPPLNPIQYNGASTGDTIRIRYSQYESGYSGPYHDNSLLVILDTNKHIAESLEFGMKYQIHPTGHSSAGSSSSFRFSALNIPYTWEGPKTIRVDLSSQKFTLVSDTTQGRAFNGPPHTWYIRTDSIMSVRPDAYLRIRLQ